MAVDATIGAESPSRSWRPARNDVILAVLVAAVIVVVFAVGLKLGDDNERQITAASFVFGPIAGLLLMFRRVRPVLTLAAIAIVIMVYVAVGSAGGPIGLPIWIGLYTVAAEGNRKRSVIAAAVTAVLVSVLVFLVGQAQPTIFEQIAAIGLTIFPLLVGDVVHSRRALWAEAEERLRLAEAATEQEAQRRVQDERVRIARDLHDVVAHSIATINVQAGVAAHVIEAEPAAAKEALTDIKEASKMAMGELRAMLGVLHAHDGDAGTGAGAGAGAGAGDTAPLAPSPGIDDVAGLIERWAGTATLDVRGTPAQPVDAASGLVVYRIIQEGLTNTLKHNVGAVAEVMIDYTDDHIGVRVVDDGGTDRRIDTDSTGLGLVGLDERVRSVGGSFGAKPRFDGGFEILASVPYEPRLSA